MNDFDFSEGFQCDRNSFKERIIQILKENKDKPIAIAINGKWGVGKTYFWKNTLAPSIGNELGKYPIYTSVFGKSNEKDIVQDLVVQFLARENSFWNKVKTIANRGLSFFVKSKGIPVNIDTSCIFRAFTKQDLENTIVCIDDFERLSNKVPIEDVLGLISELKENKGCSVIVLCNEDKLFEPYKSNSSNELEQANEIKPTKNKAIFERYREKVFDFQIKFAPPQEEQFNLLAPECLDLDFDSYEFLPDILNIAKLINSHHSLNLRELNRANCSCQLLWEYFSLKEYPSEEFKKTYNYLLFPIIYAYHFKLKVWYFSSDSTRGFGNLTSPHTSMYNNLLKSFLSDMKYGFDLIQKTGFFIIPSFVPQDENLVREDYKSFLRSFVEKIIDDTRLHKEYIQEWDKKPSTLQEASINFFLKHKNNTASVPYMFGFRILNYAFADEFDVLDKFKRTKSFAIDLVMEKHKEEVLELFNQWCDEAYNEIHLPSDNERLANFWVDESTFYTPLEYTFKNLKIPLPQNKLIDFFQKANSPRK